MIFQEVNWIRSNKEKLSYELIDHALQWYRPFRLAPCFLQRFLKGVRQTVHKVPVIVQMNESDDFQIFAADTGKNAGCKIKRELTVIHSFSAKVNAKTLVKLANDNAVSKIWLDGTVKALLDVASPAVGAPAVWKSGLSGKGVGVAVVDTGVYQHPDLAGRIAGFKDFVKNKTAAYDDNGHGTHVAGDIASDGSRSNGLYKGPAPGCNIIGVKVLSGTGSGSLSTVIQGIQWCIEKKELYNIRVINMSLGGTATQTYKNDPLCQAVEKAWKAGIVVCVAAGNEGPKSQTISSPGIDPAVITVGAIDDKNSAQFSDYTVAEYSSRGPTVDQLSKPDIVCPGTNIISLRSPNSALDRQYKNARTGTDYLSLSGTSMATPVCSGIVALMLEANSKLTPDETKTVLMQTAKPLAGEAGYDQGSGLADAEAAFKALITK